MAEKQYERTTAGLRELLFDTIVAVKNGERTSNEGKAIAALAKETIATVDLELRAQRQLAEMDPEGADAMVIAPKAINLIPAALTKQ